MKNFTAHYINNSSDIELTIISNELNYKRELIISKSDSKFLELDSCIKNFIAWYLGDKFATFKPIDSNLFLICINT